MNDISNVMDDLGFLTNPRLRDETCETHGNFTSKNIVREIWSRCPACAKERQDKEDAYHLREKIEALQRRIGHAGVPERFRDRTLASYHASGKGQQSALAFATAFAANFGTDNAVGRGAVFVGKPGTGKTHLAIGIAIDLMERGHSAMFTTTLRAIRRVKETWGKGSSEIESAAIAAIVFPELLILDEVGIQFGSDTEKLILFDVLNERYEQRKSTLMLSNLTSSEVKDYLGDRIFDRMREDGGRVVVFDWASHRRDGKP